MNLSTRVGLLAGASALTLTGVSVAGGPVGGQDTEARIAELEAQVARLKGEGWLNDQRADEVRTLVQDVLADADTRASLLQSGMSAGYDKGFVIGSTDGNFKLKMNGQLQVRFVFNNQNGDGVDANRSGFEVRRAKLAFSGHVVDPSWQYRIQGAFDYGDSGAFELEDAYIKKSYDNGWYAKAGQFKNGYLREELVSSSQQLVVERSIVNEFFTHNRVQGVQAGYEGDTFRFNASFNDGDNSSNTAALTYDTEYAFAGRAEFLFSGTWDQFRDHTSPRGGETGVMAGVAANYQSDEYGTAASGEVTRIGITGDISIEGDGWNAFAAAIWESRDDDIADDTNPFGFVVQGGIYFTDDLEGYARYEYGDLDVDGAEELSIITVGVNKYFAGNSMKWSTDIGFALNGVDALWGGGGGSLAGTGWRSDVADEDGQFVFRSQIQLLF